jgi:hypothetical protein
LLAAHASKRMDGGTGVEPADQPCLGKTCHCGGNLLELAASPSIGNGASPLSDGHPPYLGERPRGGEGADSSKTKKEKQCPLALIQSAT